MEIIPKYFSDFARHIDGRLDKQDELLETIASTVRRHEETLDEHSMMLRTMTGRHDSHEDRISHLERSVTRLRLKIDN